MMMRDYESAQKALDEAKTANSTAQKRAGEASAVLTRTARALEQSAELAEQHAQRRRRSGDNEAAAKEHALAQRASRAAERGRLQAQKLAGLTDTRPSS